MESQFDPYYTWLGIPPSQRPPTLYRLLGLQDFEPNGPVIEHAADRVMLHLRSFSSFPRRSWARTRVCRSSSCGARARR